MSRKVLFCATVDVHFKAFHLPYFQWFKERGWEVHAAASGKMELPHTDKKYDIPIRRSPFHLQNLKAYRELRAVMEENRYDLIHCHTPMGGVLARLAARESRKRGTRVLYTAHGFHFCKGAPLLNWMVYYPIEKSLAHMTDCLITINQEDSRLATSRRFQAKNKAWVHGVGVDTDRFRPVEEGYKRKLRESFGYGPEDFLMFYAAEFNKNKNQRLLIEALALVGDQFPHVRLLLAGDGPLKKECLKLATQFGVSGQVDFLGYRTDIEHLLSISDIAVASSLREGLPVNILEAMAAGLPVLASDNRGHRELVRDDENGWVFDPHDKHGFAEKIKRLCQNRYLKKKLGQKGRELTEQTYSLRRVLDEMRLIYTQQMGETEEMKWTVPKEFYTSS